MLERSQQMCQETVDGKVIVTLLTLQGQPLFGGQAFAHDDLATVAAEEMGCLSCTLVNVKGEELQTDLVGWSDCLRDGDVITVVAQDTFQITVERSSVTSWKIGTDGSDGNGVLVQEMHVRYQEQDPCYRVFLGDFIVSVNGIDGPCEALIAEFHSSAVLNLKIKEGCSAKLHRLIQLRRWCEVEALITVWSGLQEHVQHYFPLHRAIKEGPPIEIVQAFLAATVDVNKTDRVGLQAPLHIAAEEGKAEVALVLIESQAFTEARQYYGDLSPLHSTAQCGTVEVAKTLIDARAEIDPRTAYYNDGMRTPLHYAAFSGHEEIFAMLVNARADVHAVTELDKTLLHIAAQRGHMEICRTLVDAKASVLSKAVYNINLKVGDVTVLHSAVMGRSIETFSMLVSAKADLQALTTDKASILHIAAQEGSTRIAQALIEAKVDINEKDSNCMTPLHWAAHNGHAEVTRDLIKAQAIIESKGGAGYYGPLCRTPLHFAALCGHERHVMSWYRGDLWFWIGGRDDHDGAQCEYEQTVKDLIRCRANVEAKDNDQATPLFLSVSLKKLGSKRGRDDDADHCNAQVVKQLLASKANLRETVSYDMFHGMTLLHIAAHHGKAEVIKVLVEARAHLESKDTYARTPLHHAARAGEAQATKALTECRAMIDSKSKFGATALHYAAKNNHLEVTKTLIECRANPYMRDRDGHTALNDAANSRRTELVKLLAQTM